MSSLLVALRRIIIPYRLISLTVGMVLAAFYQTEAATITAKVCRSPTLGARPWHDLDYVG